MDIWDGLSRTRGPDAVRAPDGIDYSEAIWQIQETQRSVSLIDPDQIDQNTADIAALTIIVDTNTINIATNAANIAALTLDIICDTGAITDQVITVAGVITPTVENTSGDLKIEPNGEGNITLFEDAEIDNDADGNALYIYRKSVSEGTQYFKLYASQYAEAAIASNTNFLILTTGEYDITLRAVNGTVYFNPGEDKTVSFINHSYVVLTYFDEATGNWYMGSGNISTTGSIKNKVDSSKHYFGADDDAYIEFDGDNVNYATTEGGHVFTGKHITLPSITTSVRNALTPSNGMMVYNSTNSRFEQYENGLWVYKSNVITETTNLYVATTGNDTTGDGNSGNPWATIDKAIDYISNFILLATVNIIISAGDYTSDTSELIIKHPNGDFIQILGDYYYEVLTLDSVSGSTGDWDLTFLTSNTDYYDVGDYVLIYRSANGTDPELVLGVHTVKSKVASTSITLNSICGNATMASGSVTGYLITPKCKFNRMFSIYSSLMKFQGILNDFNTDSSGSYAIKCYNPSYIVMDRIILNNSGTTPQTGVGIQIDAPVSCYTRRFGARNFMYGVNAVSSYMYSSYISCIYCYYGLRANVGAILVAGESSIISCYMGSYASSMSLIATSASTTKYIDNTIDASPAVGADGNDNSRITM